MSGRGGAYQKYKDPLALAFSEAQKTFIHPIFCRRTNVRCMPPRVRAMWISFVCNSACDYTLPAGGKSGGMEQEGREMAQDEKMWRVDHGKRCRERERWPRRRVAARIDLSVSICVRACHISRCSPRTSHSTAQETRRARTRQGYHCAMRTPS